MAIVSILHRLSGLFLALMIPVFLFILSLSLHSRHSFELVQSYFHYPLIKFAVWGTLSILIYHLLAGVRHMIMDLGFGESVCVAKASSYGLLALAIIVSAAMGVWLW